MTRSTGREPRRLCAAIIGLGLDNQDGTNRIIIGKEYLGFGGSEETHSELLETLLRLDLELERIGQPLGELPPAQLAEIAWRIDSPELHAIALRLESGLNERGRSFHESTAQELTELALGAPA